LSAVITTRRTFWWPRSSRSGCASGVAREAIELRTSVIFAGTGGFLDVVPVPDCRRYEKELLAWLDRTHGPLLAEIAEKKDIKGELTDKLKAALAEFSSAFQPSAKA
jgi:F-type H+-transporting ATPase subunit alpha